MREPFDIAQTYEPPAGQLGIEEGSENYTTHLLRIVWKRQRYRIEERVRLIEGAVVLLGQGPLDTACRQEARQAAHMLAGTVGTFGFVESARAARELELELEQPRTMRVAEVSALVCNVRQGLESQAGGAAT
jgi:Hpt domain